jgi:hypothetical protein
LAKWPNAAGKRDKVGCVKGRVPKERPQYVILCMTYAMGMYVYLKIQKREIARMKKGFSS